MVGEPDVSHLDQEDILEGEHVRDANRPVPNAHQYLRPNVVEVIGADGNVPKDNCRQAGVVERA